jgi:hypothetical protein
MEIVLSVLLPVGKISGTVPGKRETGGEQASWFMQRKFGCRHTNSWSLI